MSEANHIYPPENRDEAYCGRRSQERLPTDPDLPICAECDRLASKRGLARYERLPAGGHRLVRA